MLALTFPVYFSAGPFRVSAHLVFEALAYTIGFQIYRLIRARRGDVIGGDMRWTVIAAAAVGAAIGSKVLSWFEDPGLTLEWIRTNPALLMSGKTIVGGFLGGTIAVEIAKWFAGERRSTGDLFVVPLCIGTAVGRIGCFLSGLADHTFGTPTSLPWGVDFGDGIARHPTQLYEVAFMLALATALWRLSRAVPPLVRGGGASAFAPASTDKSAPPTPVSGLQNGDLFKLFMFSYFAFRLAIDGIKPAPALAGLSAIQWTCAAAVIWYGRHIPRMLRVARRRDPAIA